LADADTDADAAAGADAAPDADVDGAEEAVGLGLGEEPVAVHAATIAASRARDRSLREVRVMVHPAGGRRSLRP
jgi:hypothetical protein